MTIALRRAGLLVFAVAAIAAVAWNVMPATPTATRDAGLPPPSEDPIPTIAPGPPDATSVQPRETRDYAIAHDELQGLPPDVPSGTLVELWVGWARPTGGPPKLQRLIPRAEFVRLVPPVTPGGSTAVVLRVPVGRMPDLLWADGYGSLSVAIP